MSLFENYRTGDKIEVRDDRDDGNFNPSRTGGVTFFKGLNSVFDSHGGSKGAPDSIEGVSNIPRHLSSMAPQTTRPVSQGQFGAANKQSRIVNRSIRLKDDIASGLRSSADRSSTLKNSNFGTIMNFKKTEGINDQSIKGSFRKWTGMPQTTRDKKIPGLTTLNVN